MIIDFSELKASNIYHVMTQTIIPRPVAWILSDSGDGSLNLAPFSYFNAICSDPPLVVISVGKKPDGGDKDTRVNILERKKLTIHIATVEQAAAVTETSRTLPHGESELDNIELNLVNEPGWDLPRLAEAPVAMACEFYDMHELGPGKQAIFYCKIKEVFVNDAFVNYDAKNRLSIDASGINPLGRLGGGEYVTFGDKFSLTRPA